MLSTRYIFMTFPIVALRGKSYGRFLDEEDHKNETPYITPPNATTACNNTYRVGYPRPAYYRFPRQILHQPCHSSIKLMPMMTFGYANSLAN